jgi:predicted dehydrogenase
MAAQAQQSFVVPDGPAAGKTVPVEVEDNWHFVLDLGDARLASISANNVVRATRAPELEIYGLEGTIAVNLLDVSAPVEIQRAGRGWEQIAVNHSGRDSGPDHHLGVEHLVDCIQHDRQPVLSVDHALHVVEIIERGARSSAEGRMIAVERSF